MVAEISREPIIKPTVWNDDCGRRPDTASSEAVEVDEAVFVPSLLPVAEDPRLEMTLASVGMAVAVLEAIPLLLQKTSPQAAPFL